MTVSASPVTVAPTAQESHRRGRGGRGARLIAHHSGKLRLVIIGGGAWRREEERWHCVNMRMHGWRTWRMVDERRAPYS